MLAGSNPRAPVEEVKLGSVLVQVMHAGVLITVIALRSTCCPRFRDQVPRLTVGTFSACFLPQMTTKYKPELMFVHFDEIDDAGHSSGWGSSVYYKVVTVIQRFVLSLLRIFMVYCVGNFAT